MLIIKKFLIVIACTSCIAAQADYCDEYIQRSRYNIDMNLQHSMMQSQVNAMYKSHTQYPVQIKQEYTETNTRPTYVIEKPLYKFGEVNNEN